MTKGKDVSRESWDRYYISMAELVATRSKDRSTKVGAVIVGPDNEQRSTGYNGFPRGVCDDVEHRHERPAKYAYTEHAERNALFNALRSHTAVAGCTLYLNYIPWPCHDCARAIIQSGIKRVVGPSKEFPGKGEQWEESMRISREMLREAGVEIDVIQDY